MSTLYPSAPGTSTIRSRISKLAGIEVAYIPPEYELSSTTYVAVLGGHQVIVTRDDDGDTYVACRQGDAVWRFLEMAFIGTMYVIYVDPPEGRSPGVFVVVPPEVVQLLKNPTSSTAADGDDCLSVCR